MGDYLRYKSSIGNTLSELVIRVTAREWSQGPTAMNADEEVIYGDASELLRNERVSDATFERVEGRFGTKGAVDTTGIVGYDTLLAMELNTAQYKAKGQTPLKRLPEEPGN